MLPGFRGIDWASLVATYLFQFLWLLALYAIFGGLLDDRRGRPVPAAGRGDRARQGGDLWLLIVVVIVQAILSWVAPDGPLAGLLNALTFPFLRPIRRFCRRSAARSTCRR